MENFSTDLLQNKTEYKAETLSYVGNVSMPYPHYHEHYEILYVRENTRILILDKDKYILDNNKIALIKPFLIHKTISDENKNQKRTLINFSFNAGEEILAFSNQNILKCFDYPIIQLSENLKKDITKCLDEFSSLQEKDPFYEIEFKSVLLKLLTLLSKEITLTNNQETITKKGIATIIPDIAKKIQLCYNEEITLNGLADEFHISQCHLSRCFKKIIGISLTKYINNIRIIASQKLIDEGYTSVTAIAMQVGFSNITHFERVFKSLTGFSPKKYILQKNGCKK